MAHNPVPWIGTLALVAMFVIPFLPDWIFEGPRTVRHWPRRHVCGECGAGWTDGHVWQTRPRPRPGGEGGAGWPDGHVCETAQPAPVLPARSGRSARPRAEWPVRPRSPL